MKPYYQDAAVTLYHGDCREILPGLGPLDAIVSDPPYGMAWDTDSSRFSGGEPSSSAKRGRGRTNWGDVHGDREPFNPTPLLEYPEVVLWGSNHYGQWLPVGTTLVWVKRLDGAFGSFLSDAEIGWMKGGHGVYCWRDVSFNCHTRERVHPTQKPVPLMQWAIQRLGDATTICDPYMGSGSVILAAKNLGRRAIGIEIEERYCEIAAKRCAQEVLPFGG